MSFFNRVGAFFGFTEVVEKNGYIHVYNIPKIYAAIVDYADRYYRNKKIYKAIFTQKGRVVSFPSFYLVEFITILTYIKASTNKYGLRRYIDSLFRQLKEKTWYASLAADKDVHLLNLQNLKNFKIRPFPKQLEFLSFIDTNIPRRKLRGYVLAADPGTGKCMPVDTPIYTPKGWIRLKNIEIGDYVYTHTRIPAKVLNVYPQKLDTVYNITFEDGRTVKATGDHKWAIYRNDSPDYELRTTLEIIESLDTGNDELSIPLIKPNYINRKQGSKLLHSWVIGYLAYSSEITEYGIKVDIRNDDILGKLSNHLYIMKCNLKRIDGEWYIDGATDLMSKISAYMDRIYKLTSKSFYGVSPLSLHYIDYINGAMDYGGYITKSGKIKFRSRNKNTAEIVQYLIRAIGGIASISYKENYYVVSIRYRKPRQLFSLISYHHPVNPASCDRLKITRISREDQPEYVKCILIDHPEHLYVAKDFIVTHNTYMDLAFLECLPPQLAQVKIVISPKNAVVKVWEDHLDTKYKRKVTYWSTVNHGPAPLGKEFYIFHYEAIDRAVDLAQRLLRQNLRYAVIVDESHNFNEINSKRSQLMIKLCNLRNDIYSLWASGTPFKALGVEMFTVLRCIDNYFTPEVMVSFRKTFGGDRLTHEAMYILQNRIKMFLYTIPKKDIVQQGQEPIVKKIMVKIPDFRRFTTEAIKKDMVDYISTKLQAYRDNMKQYDDIFFRILDKHKSRIKTASQMKQFNEYYAVILQLKKNKGQFGFGINNLLQQAKLYETRYLIPQLSREDRNEFLKVKTIVKSAASKVVGEALGNIYTRRKIEATCALARYAELDDIINNADAKTLIYSSYKSVVVSLGESLSSSGEFTPALIYGDTNKNLNAIITAFAKNELVNPLIATFKSLSTAVPLTMANTIIMMDVPVREYIYKQTVARVWRLGQKEQTYIYEVYMDTGSVPNITTRAEEILSWSRDQVKMLMGDEFSDNDLDDMNRNPDE